jgi:hypothetical protein
MEVTLWFLIMILLFKGFLTFIMLQVPAQLNDEFLQVMLVNLVKTIEHRTVNVPTHLLLFVMLLRDIDLV